MLDLSVSYISAFAAGLLTFFTPCILPLLPVYFTIITGLSLDDLTDAPRTDTRKKVFIATLLFVLGFSVVFILLGASASLAGGFVESHRTVFKLVGGHVIVLLGLHLAGIINLPWLAREARVHTGKRPWHLFGAFAAGLAFAAGWTPCIGPILGSILIIAGSQDTVVNGILLLSVFSLGLALPFLFLSVFIDRLLIFLKRMQRLIRFINPATGILLIAVGLFLMINPS